jgi:hypothetical protein
MNIQIKEVVVTNDGDEIGIIQDSTCHLSAKVGPTVKGAIRKESGIVDLQFIVGDAPEKEDKDNGDAKPSLATMSDDDLAAEMKRRGLIQDAPEAPAIVQPPVKQIDLSAVMRLHWKAEHGEIPKPPAKLPAMGDKTPEYVAWFKTHATPEEIAVRYPDSRRVPATVAEFAKAEAKLQDKLPGEKKDSNKENDFTDSKEAA